MFLKNIKQIFANKKFEKPTFKSWLEIPKFVLPYCPELPKQKNLCPNMWLIDQLYIELGFRQAICSRDK